MRGAVPEWLTVEVPGATDLIALFGYWPSFHDSEVIAIELVQSGPSRLSVHTFERSSEVNQKGQYICRKHVVVTFLFRGIRGLELSGFNHQSVIWGLTLRKVEEATN